MEENQIKQKTNKDPKQNIIKFIIMLITVFTLEQFIRNPLRKLSTSFQLAFNFQKANLCSTFSFLSFIENDLFIYILILVLNFANTYAALTILFLKSFVYYLNGILKLFYLDSRPFWVEEQLVPCVCSGNYGNPSTSAYCQFLIYFAVYRAFSTTCKINKLLLKILCIFPAFLVVAGRILQNIHSFNQILFGFALGYLTYFFVFEVLHCNFNKEKQFKWIVKNIFTIIMFSLFLIVFAFVFHLCMDLTVNNNWLDTITKYCNYKEYFFFDNESYVKTCKLFLFLGGLCGCYIECAFSYKNKVDVYARHNVDSSMKFNNTKLWITLWRVVLMSVVFVMLRHLFVFSIFARVNDKSFALFLLFRNILPLFLDGVSVFSFLKFTVTLASLTNENYPKFVSEKKDFPHTKSFNSLILMSFENNVHENLI